MKVILTKNVPKLGDVGDICEVAPGYGRNYLIPQGMAILATPGARRQIDDLRRTERRRLARLRSDAEQLAERIAGTRLDFAARVGETGRLYGSITASDIAEALSARIGVAIDRRKIHLEEPLRTLGEHEVTVHLLPQVQAPIVVNIESEAEEGASKRTGTPGEPSEGRGLGQAAEPAPEAPQPTRLAGTGDDAAPKAGQEPADVGGIEPAGGQTAGPPSGTHGANGAPPPAGDERGGRAEA